VDCQGRYEGRRQPQLDTNLLPYAELASRGDRLQTEVHQVNIRAKFIKFTILSSYCENAAMNRCVRVCVCMRVCVRACMRVRVRTRVCVCVCVRVCVWAHVWAAISSELANLTVPNSCCEGGMPLRLRPAGRRRVRLLQPNTCGRAEGAPSTAQHLAGLGQSPSLQPCIRPFVVSSSSSYPLCLWPTRITGYRVSVVGEPVEN